MSANRLEQIDKAYHVKINDENYCVKCSQGRMWDVIGPDGYAIGISYHYQGDADDMCEMLNSAFDLGRTEGQSHE